jgi:hypothetical protein
VELPEDFQERAAEIMETHLAYPVAEGKRGKPCFVRYLLVLKRPVRCLQCQARFVLEQVLHESQRGVRCRGGPVVWRLTSLRFFKDRNWLRLEYPELIACSEADVSGFIETRSWLMEFRLDPRLFWK